jgi:hypothetical protein
MIVIKCLPSAVAAIRPYPVVFGLRRGFGVNWPAIPCVSARSAARSRTALPIAECLGRPIVIANASIDFAYGFAGADAALRTRLLKIGFIRIAVAEKGLA